MENSTIKKPAKHVHITNKKASYEFHLMDEFDAGIVLFGSEIKSIRLGNANISAAYCYLNDKKLLIKNMHISELKNSVNTHDPLRERALLITKKEYRKIENNLKTSGITLVPTLLYTNKNGLAKIKIYLAKGKKLYDKRESIKAKDIQRDVQRGE